MRRMTQALALLLMPLGVNGQNPQTPQTEKVKTVNQEFFAKASNSAIFIYDDSTKPCEPPPPGHILLPLGSAFVAGIEDLKQAKPESKPDAWVGWMFLITAKHVITGRNTIKIRLNSTDGTKFVCDSIDLTKPGTVFPAVQGVDIVAISLIPKDDAKPVVLPSNMLIDSKQMDDWSLGVGTEVLSIGYLYSYSGQTKNFPIAKFGHISLITEENWYFNLDSQLQEKGYVLDMANTPGMSGAPVFTHGMEVEPGLRYRELPPYLVGVVKGLMLAPVGDAKISQGVAVIEPGGNVKALMKQIAILLKAQGDDVPDIK